MKKLIIAGIILLTVVSCELLSRYAGYTRTLSGIHYKLLTLGENSKKPMVGDYITVDIAYKTIVRDSTFFEARRKFMLTQSDYYGSIDECFKMLSVGDKASFIIDAEKFFTKTLKTELPKFIKPGGVVTIEVAMLEIQSPAEYENEKIAFLNWCNDFGDYEKVILKQFIDQKQLKVRPTSSGMYYLKLKPGNGKQVNKGDTVVIDYEGKFFNGKFFDSTIKRNEPFQFVYGTEWQVVKGLEEAVGMMTEGEKALFIVPSELAFGTEGSSTNIIPPYTSLIFEVELKKVN
jgi:FKBP-type peptidyl-prolyl cis-trans isomerase FkpA